MVQHQGTKTLDTERLQLRQITRGDGPVLFETCFGNPNVTKFLRYETHPDLDETDRIIDIWTESYKKTDFYLWVIVLKENGEPIGTVGCDKEGWDADAAGALGYQLAEKHWGKGYMTEAVSAVIKFMFEQVGLNRIEVYHSTRNPASGAVMRRCGMQYEGMCREKYYCSQGYQDCNMYAILKSDYMGRGI